MTPPMGTPRTYAERFNGSINGSVTTPAGARLLAPPDGAASLAPDRLGHEAGVADQVIFEIAGSTTFPLRERYDLIAFFDCLHDFGDPVGAVQRAREALAVDGTVLIVEPMVGETVEANLNPVGRVYSGASVLCCTPNAIASGQTALGTLATEAALLDVVTQGGFTHFRRAAGTPFNRVFEARP